jgi:HK97 gp10 family phage protein
MLIRVLNIDKCLKKLGNISNLDLSSAYNKSAQLVQRVAKEKAPVNKDPDAPTRDNLRSSIRRYRIGGSYRNGAAVGTDVEYAIYQEFGTYKMAAQPFLIPALKENEKTIIREIALEVNKKIKEESAK